MFPPPKPLPADVLIAKADWSRDDAGIATLRRRVFIAEQGVPESLEWEQIDPRCAWFVASGGGQVIGIARLTPDGRIGRMAVDKAWRGRGIGSALLEATLTAAREAGLAEARLNAQSHAVVFYERFGFAAEGAEFDEAGIPHRHMRLALKGD